MKFSTSNAYETGGLPPLTSDICSEALTKFFQSQTELLVATEASSHPSGLVSLFSQPYVYAGGGLGNMDECPLQVCLAGDTHRDSLTFASVCIPEECNALDLAAPDFLEKLNLSSEVTINPATATEYKTLHKHISDLNIFLNTGWVCGEYHVPFHIFPFGGPYILLTVTLITLTTIATMWNQEKDQHKIHKRKHKANAKKRRSCDECEEEEKDDYSLNITSMAENGNSEIHQFSSFQVLLSNWNMHTNIQKLLVRRESTACLDGLRVGSILWVILGHVLAIQSSAGGGYNNPAAFLPPNGFTATFFGQLLFSARFAVDTFLFISGFLVVHVICAKIPRRATEQKSFGYQYIMYIPKLILNRLMRIIPLYSISLGFWVEIAPHLGSGPFWFQWESLLEPCRQFGWTNWMFVNNILPLGVPSVETCFYHSWYLALDFQLFIFAPLLVFWFQQFPKGGKIATGILMFLSIIITMYLARTRLWSINSFDGEQIARFDMEGYAKPHIRAQTYLAGMLLGMILQQKDLHQRHDDHSCIRNDGIVRPKIRIRMLMIVALILLGMVTFITVTGAYSRRACGFAEWPTLNDCGSIWTSEQTFWYAATSRAFWAVGIGIICYLCLRGCGGIINNVLSLSLWTPLSHLSFGAYLLHPIIIFTKQLGNRQKEPFDLKVFGFDFLSISVLSFSLALIFALLVEIPFARLVQQLTKRSSHRKRITGNDYVNYASYCCESESLVHSEEKRKKTHYGTDSYE